MKEEFTGIARAYGYSSSKKKHEAVTAQNEAITEYAERLHFDLPFTNFFEHESDLDISVFERPKAKALLDELGQFHHLIVTRIDLLGRSPIEVLETLMAFLDKAVTVHLLDLEGIVFDKCGATGKSAIALIRWAARTERKYRNSIEEHADAIQTKLDAKREQGLVTGTVPYGWSAKDTGKITPKGVKVRRLVDNPDEQKWILRMAELRVAGWSYHRIAKELNALGAPTKHGRGDVLNLRNGPSVADAESSKTRSTCGRWQSGNVANVLNNRTVREWLAKR